MSEQSGFEFDDAPRLNFVDKVLGQHTLDPETIRPYHQEAVEVAATICTEGIAKYLNGSLEYTRATSRPVPYRDGHSIGIGLTGGPAALFDSRTVEVVELGLFVPGKSKDLEFRTLAELREDQIKTGGLANPRINDPADLDSFMRGLRYVARKTV